AGRGNKPDGSVRQNSVDVEENDFDAAGPILSAQCHESILSFAQATIEAWTKTRSPRSPRSTPKTITWMGRTWSSPRPIISSAVTVAARAAAIALIAIATPKRRDQ